ncbi:MAG TPA: hypothetical protein VFR59_07550 [Steroidobacteraceae bacterium]|nr:hypothetical protein [Steroidobacteraceae bacterium]
MALVEKISALRLPFLQKKQKPEEDERLMQLFRNRAGLKKAHATLQDQLYEMKERLKQQDGATTRAQEQLEALEIMLGNPDAGFGALVFFQLRGLWRACNVQLEQFAAELERQQEERERRKQMFEFNQELKNRLAIVDGRLAIAEDRVREQTDLKAALEDKLLRLRGFWNYFRRRNVRRELERQNVHLQATQNDCAAIREEHAALEMEQAPAWPGLSVDGRRAINLATIAYALVLGSRLSTFGLAARTKEAMQRRVHEAQYGARAECETLMVAIAQALAAVRSRKDLAAEIKVCVDQLREAAQYRSANDAVPLGETLGAVLPSSPDGRAVLTLSAPQILADDYWNIYKVLLR